MKKEKKLFNYEKQTIESKELEDDLRLASELIEKLKKVDPIDVRRRRREKFIDMVAISLFSILYIFVFYVGFDVGLSTALDTAESIYDYSVTTGLFVPKE